MKAYTIGLYEKALPETLNWKEKLEVAKQIGYDFMEISIDETKEKLARLDMSKQDRLTLIETMYQVGIPIRSLCLSGHRKYPLGSNDVNIVNKSLKIMEKAITLADDLGIRIIMLAGYDVYYEKSNEETKKRFYQNLIKVEHMANAKGILLGFETMETEFMNTVHKSMKYVQAMHSPYLGIYPDTGNIKNAAVMYKSDVYFDLSSGAGHLLAMHLKETVPDKFREIPYGTGHVNFEKLIQTAWELGIRRYVTEFWYLGNKDWKNDVLFAYQKMVEILENMKN